MKLGKALQVLAGVDAKAPEFTVGLASGFTPLHLGTLLTAELQQRMPAWRVKLEAGLFGDLCGNIRRAAEHSHEAVCVPVEWADLDARLSLRQTGSWDVDALPDMLLTCRASLGALEACLARAAARMPVVVSAPTLPILPVSHERAMQSGSFELQLRGEVAAWLARMGVIQGVRIVRAQALDIASVPGERFDVQSELHFGFPYSMPHAGELAAVFAALVVPPAPKKGLITDLDDTLWKGALGEVGAEGISWDLDHGSQVHAAYQRMLNSLASAGILIGVASRNEAANVQKAFERADLVVVPKRLYPVEAAWGPKSPLIRRILDAWNIGAGDVVFVDNMAAELGEVQLAYPGITGVLFPEHAQDVPVMLERLRDLFGQEHVSHEDALRAATLRGAEAFRQEAAKSGDSAEEFLSQAQAELTFTLEPRTDDARVFELLNKTNQFNLNGRRYTEQAWRSRWDGKNAFALTAEYQDKYGALGRIAVLSGFKRGSAIDADVWVMSCRAFSRRIEHQTLAYLFETLGATEIAFDFRPTEKNAILGEFLEHFTRTEGDRRVCRREDFEQAMPRTYFTLKERPHGV